MSRMSAKEAIAALLERAGLEVTAAAKALEATAAGRPIAWEKLFPTGGTLGLTDQACDINRTCRSNDACTSVR